MEPPAGRPFRERGVGASMHDLLVSRAGQHALHGHAMPQVSVEPEPEVAHFGIGRQGKVEVAAGDPIERAVIRQLVLRPREMSAHGDMDADGAELERDLAVVSIDDEGGHGRECARSECEEGEGNHPVTHVPLEGGVIRSETGRCRLFTQAIPVQSVTAGIGFAIICSQEVCMITKKLQAAVLSAALLLPAGGAFGNDWSKSDSRTKGTVVGAVAGALVAGKKGAVIGAAVGNGVQAVRHTQHRHHHKRHHKKH